MPYNPHTKALSRPSALRLKLSKVQPNSPSQSSSTRFSMSFPIPGIWAGIGADLPNQGDQPHSDPLQAHGIRTDVSTGVAGCHCGVVDGGLKIAEDGLLTAISGNHYWHDREIADVALRRNTHEALAFAYRRYGEELLEKLAGRFCVLLWDPQQRIGVAATDRFGMMPVYWLGDGNRIALAPTADQALRLLDKERQVSMQGIYHYLFFHMVPSPGTIFEGLHKLPAAHALRLSTSGATPFCYWQPDFNPPASARIRRSGNQMLQLLQSAVVQLDNGEDTGAFLSGGLDSSTVAGLLANHRPQPATFSMGFDAKGYDEIAFARIAAKRFGTRLHEYYVTPEDVLEALPKVAAAYDEPFGNSSAIPAYFCARLAVENGMQRLLAGDGGDELFAGNERYARQTVFEAYDAIVPKWLDRFLLRPLAGRLPEGGLVGKFASYVNQAHIPLPKRLHTYNFLTRFAPETLFTDEFLAQVDRDQPFALEAEIYHRPEKASRLERMLYLDWQHTLADNDLRKVNRMCQLAGIQVEYPMLDDLVVEFSARVSSWEKLRFNKLRDYYKRAVKGWLPDEIINKSKHGFGLPFGVWMTDHAGLQALARENLGKLRDRNIINPQFLDQLLELHGSSHAGYYGEMVWILVMLELWMDTHGI